jgi:hypothetical protein
MYEDTEQLRHNLRIISLQLHELNDVCNVLQLRHVIRTVFSDDTSEEELLQTILAKLNVKTYFKTFILPFWKRMFPFTNLCQSPQLVHQIRLVNTLA